jgi:hypothetical protein
MLRLFPAMDEGYSHPGAQQDQLFLRLLGSSACAGESSVNWFVVEIARSLDGKRLIVKIRVCFMTQSVQMMLAAEVVTIICEVVRL